ncbi:MAG: hypothetical protein LBF55_05640 [Prevotellaceae bacterium]|jgi:hypothetical protein|nr:hypothetical protein [Prevotellaceae bacterium]
MQLTVIKHDAPYASKVDGSLGIQTFGDGNSYPQDVLEVVGGSSTGLSCVNTYAKFIQGRGFSDLEFYGLTVNRRGETNDTLLAQVAHDYAAFGGFYVHVNYDMSYKVNELSWIPFENVRLGALQEDGTFRKVAVHWDWAKRYGRLRRWKKEDIDYIDIFNPDPDAIARQVVEAGSWGKYKGQVFIFSGGKSGSYPTPIYSPVLTDMSTEAGLANIAYRSVRNNFFVGAMLVEVKSEDQTAEQASQTETTLKAFQGDENACKIMYGAVRSKEDIPVVVPFQTQSYDKEFVTTERTVRERIGRSFSQPPILRAENVGAGFGADLVEHAYNYYNSVTETERLSVERAFAELFERWAGKAFSDFSVLPLTFSHSKLTAETAESLYRDSVITLNEYRAALGMEELEAGDVYLSDMQRVPLAVRIGADGMKALQGILADATIKPDRKVEVIVQLFDLDPEDAKKMVYGSAPPPPQNKKRGLAQWLGIK